MNIYPYLIFLHVAGAMGIFAALSIEAVAVGGLRRANTTAGAHTWMGVLAMPARIGGISMLTTLVTGIWMMARWWGPQPWLQAAFVAVVVMAVMGVAVTRRAVQRLRNALAEETATELSGAFRSLRSSHALAVSFRVRIVFASGILALMTMKPGIAGVFIIMAATVVAGLIAIIPSDGGGRTVVEPGRAGGVS